MIQHKTFHFQKIVRQVTREQPPRIMKRVLTAIPPLRPLPIAFKHVLEW